MERARVIWERLGLGELKPESPWHGYDLGVWPPNLERQANLATQSAYFDFSDELIAGRRSDVNMNDPVER
jgi:4-hydroxy-3-polyprenylbenzoate decarboxylase